MIIVSTRLPRLPTVQNQNGGFDGGSADWKDIPLNFQSGWADFVSATKAIDNKEYLILSPCHHSCGH